MGDIRVDVGGGEGDYTGLWHLPQYGAIQFFPYILTLFSVEHLTS